MIMENTKNDYYSPLDVTSYYIGLDITPEMVNAKNIVAIDTATISYADELTVNIHGEYLSEAVASMGADALRVQIIYVLLRKNTIKKISYVGKNSGRNIPFSKHGLVYSEIADLSGYGNALYVDSYGDLKKNIERTVKIEIRTFKLPDGSNWTTVYTNPKWEKKLGTHNSLAYGEYKHSGFDNIKGKYSRCQTLTVQEQYEKGVRMFDVRVRRDDDTGKPMAAHGMIGFETDVEECLSFLNSKPNIFIRLMLENQNFIIEDKRTKHFSWFKNEYVPHLLRDYPNLKFVRGRAKYDDEKLVDIAEEPPYEQYVDKGGLTTPKDYAEDNNHKNKNKINYDTWSLFDFIEIGLDL